MCDGGHIKHPRWAGSHGSSAEPVKGPRGKAMDRLRAGPNLTTSDLCGIPVPRREVEGSDVHEDGDVKVEIWYAGAGYRVTAVVAFVRLARDVACERALRDGDCDWDNVEATYYVQHGEYLGYRRFGKFLVERQARHVAVDRNNRMNAYGAGNMRIEQ